MNRREFSKVLAAAGALSLGPSLARSQTPSSTAPFKFSFMMWAIEKVAPFEQCMEIVAAAGYQGIELTGQPQKWSSEESRRYKAKLKTLGLVVDSMSGVKAGFAVPEQTQDFLTQLDAHLKQAVELECPQVILLSGKRVPGMDPAAQRSAAVENLKRGVDMASKHNIQIVIEPIDHLENPPIYLASVTEAFEIVREIGSPQLRVLYDFYHEQREFGNLIEKLEKNIDLIALVHIADVPGRHEPGTGEIDYANIFRKLAELKYNKFVAMEYYPTYDLTASLRNSRMAALQALKGSPAPDGK